jgi:TolA-binding protein
MNKLLLILAMFLVCTQSWASPAGVTSVFDIGNSVKAQSLGGAYTAGSGDSSSVYFNPAALDMIEKTEIQAAYIPLFFDTTYNYLCAAVPTMDAGTFGFSAAMINTDKIFFRDENGIKTGDTSQVLAEVIAGWGMGVLNDDLHAGFNIKLDYQSIKNYSNDLAFAMDMALFYRTINDSDQTLYTGLTLKNIIEPELKLGTVNDRIPRQLIAGASYIRPFSKDISASVNTDIVIPFGVDFDFKCGVELDFFKVLALRAGYSTFGIMSAGAGLTLFESVTLDYGLFFTQLDTQNRFSLKYVFGQNVVDSRKMKTELEEARIEKMAKSLAAKQLEQLRGNIDKMKDKERFKALHYTKGLESYFDGDLKRAYIEFSTVYEIDSSYMSVVYYTSYIKGALDKTKQGNYSDEVVKLYRDGVALYLKQDYKGAKDKWESILKIDPYNRLAIENLKEVNPLLRDLEGFKEAK